MTGFDGKRRTAVNELAARIEHIVHQRDVCLKRAEESRLDAERDEGYAYDLEVTRFEYCAILAKVT